MKTLQRAASLILSALLLLSVFPAQISAASLPSAPEPGNPTLKVAGSNPYITVKTYFPDGKDFYNGERFTCIPPNLYIEATEPITSVTAVSIVYESYNTPTYKQVSLDVTTGAATAVATFSGAVNGTIEVTVKAGSHDLTVKLYINHTIGETIKGRGYREEITYPATCNHQARDIMYYVCGGCHAMYASYVSVVKDSEPKGHTFVEYPNISLCNGNVVTLEKCSDCGYVKLVSGEFGDGHEWEQSATVHAATCVSDGVQYIKCHDCDAIYIPAESETGGMTVLNMKGHDFPSWNDTSKLEYVPATCSAQGTLTRRCKNCGVESVRYYPRLSHSWVYDDAAAAKVPCGETANIFAQCSKCNETTNEYSYTAPSHSYAYQVVSESTCSVAGLGAEVCQRCGDRINETTLPTKEHVIEADDGDCTTPRKCVNCGEIVEQGQATHAFEKYASNGSQHWYTCSNPGCNQISAGEPHSPPTNCQHSYFCTICGGWVPPKPHTPSETYETDGGFHRQKCALCGQYISIAIHSTTNNDNDCTTPLVCDVCHVAWVSGMPNHNYAYVTVDDQNHRQICTNNGCTAVNVLEPHSWGEPTKMNEVPATCTMPGSYLNVYECSVCHAKKTETVTTEATGHQYDGTIHNSADGEHDCTGATYTYRDCIVCGEREILTENPGTGEHNWASVFTIDKQATCATEGSMSIHCLNENCIGRKDAQTIPKTEDHNYNLVPEKTVLPTCTLQGAYVYVCSNCGHEKYEPIPPAGHTYDADYVYNEDADCQHPGTMTRFCKVCNLPDTVSDPTHPQTNHLFVDYVYQDDATIERNGTEIAYCSYGCGAFDVREAADSKLHSHSFTNYQIVTPATCTEPETRQAKCDVCGTPSEIETVEGTELGHVADVPTLISAATCTADEVIGVKCQRCGTVLETGSRPGTMLGHSFTVYVSNNDATPESNATETAVCDNGCGATDTREIPGTRLEEHIFANYVYDNNATCTRDGTETAYCENGCGSYNTRVVPGTAKGHVKDTGTVIKRPTATESGEISYRCTVCGELLEPEVLAPGSDYPDNGNISREVVPEPGAPAVSFGNRGVSFAVLSEEELKSVDNGAVVKITLNVAPADEKVAGIEKELVEAFAESTEYTVEQYLDIELFKDINNYVSQVEKTAQPLRLVITIPSEMRSRDRAFAMVRIHDGKADVLPDLDNDVNTLTFETDRFSIYAIVHKPAPVHNHTMAYLCDQNYHYLVCTTCGERLMTAPHVFAGNRCQACGYTVSMGVPPQGQLLPADPSAGGLVDVSTPTEGTVNLED